MSNSINPQFYLINSIMKHTMIAATQLLSKILKVKKTDDASWRDESERFNVILKADAKILPIGHATFSCGWYAQGKGPQVCSSAIADGND